MWTREYSLDAARADIKKLEADLALERAKCDCNHDQKKALERDLRDAKDILRNMENEALARMGVK